MDREESELHGYGDIKVPESCASLIQMSSAVLSVIMYSYTRRKILHNLIVWCGINWSGVKR